MRWRNGLVDRVRSVGAGGAFFGLGVGCGMD